MRLHIVSDLHTEFAPFDCPVVKSDILIAAGDIGVGLAGANFLKALAENRPIIYIAGNHEYYGSAIPRLTDKLRASCAGTNVHFLENDAVVLGGIRFLGCTLWTDYRLFGDHNIIPAALVAREKLTDYRKIRVSPGFRRLTPKDASAFHLQSRRWLKTMLLDGALPTVVVTHHAPTPLSLPHGWRDDLSNAAYASDLEDLISSSGPLLWIHGHTHTAIDTTLHRTRLLSNARGYPDEPAPGFNPALVIEL